MKKYIFTNEDRRIIAIQDCELFPDENLKDLEFDFPEDFEFGTEENYKFVNNQLIYEPSIIEIQDAETTILEDLITELSALKIILGVQ